MNKTLILNNPNIDGTRKGVMGIPKDKVIQLNILSVVLKDHKFNPEITKGVINKVLNLNLTDSQFAKFVLQIYKLSNAGRYSLTYNKMFEDMVGNKQSIKKLIRIAGTEEAWPELYSNNYLNREEKNSIEKMYRREYYAMLHTIENSDSYSDNLLPCEINDQKTVTLNDEGIKYTTMYSECYEKICITENKQTGKIISLGNNDIPQVAYVGDKGKKFCINLVDLIERLAKGNYINPDTNMEFSKTLISQLLSKYEKEIKMYKYFFRELKFSGK